MSIYIRSSYCGCYRIKKKLPKRFINIDKRKDSKYKEWYKKKQKKFTNDIQKYIDDIWWDNLEENAKKKLFKIYKPTLKKNYKIIKENEIIQFIKNRRWRFISQYGKCKYYKLIENLDDILD
jgi:uncharacterized membrane protein YheB (UPF0754 family)